MAREKQHVFSARTTEEGLRQLNGVKDQLKVSWDDLVIDAVCDRYGLDRAVMAPPKRDRPVKEVQSEAEQPSSEEAPPEQSTTPEQAQPAEETPTKKKGKGKGKNN